MGRYEEAIPKLEKALALKPKFFPALLNLAACYSSLGREEEARETTEKILKLNPKFSLERFAKTMLHRGAVKERYLAALRKAGLPETPPLPLPDKPSIAVLPFVNMSGDPEQEYFVDGMTDDLITDLSKISSLFVIARNSVFGYKGKPVDVKKVSRELGVRHVLEGSVRKAGNQVRINAQLIDASTGGHLWAERYDGKMDDVFALQDKITQKIVTALAVKLTGVEQEEVARKDTDNTAAYDALLKGYEYYFRGTVDDAVMAISYFEKAIELDQNYGRAYAALAKTYFLGPKIGREWYTKAGLRFQENMARARHYLEMANKRPTFTSHQIASRMALQRRQYKKALAEAELALSLEPNGVESNFSMGYILVFLGRAKEGIGYLKRSIELDPLRPGWALFYMGLAHFSMGQFDEAVELINRALTYNPKTLLMSGILAAVYAYLGRDEEARDRLQNYLRGFYRRPNLNTIMSDWPFKDPKVADRLAEGLIKAGLPGQASDYCKVIEENKLKGEGIRTLLFGRTINGWGTAAVKTVPWTIIFTKDGRVEYMRSEFYDTGKSWIEGDSVFYQYETRFEGRKISSEVYRNPDGTPENMNEYFFIHDNGISPFSVKG
jgi:TolB-like protein/Flp pilus assembly protein TadD